MQPRQALIPLFSEFIILAEDRFSHWQVDSRLKRSMEERAKKRSEVSENLWGVYWHRLWQQQPESLAKGHLIAYLQEPCYWSAARISRGLRNSQYKLSDCFQIAIAQVDKILKGFDSQQSSNLKGYAAQMFKSILTNTLRQSQVADICSDWALLRKVSRKRLEKALDEAGVATGDREKYVLVWTSFKATYIPNEPGKTRQLTAPNAETWEAIASLYNRERHRQLNSPGKECLPSTLEKWLLKCIAAVRSYSYPKSISLQQPKMGREGEEGEILDDLVYGDASSSLLDELVRQGEVEKQQQVGELLRRILNQLEQEKPELSVLLQLYYGEQLNQNEIGQRLAMRQYTVSRRLTQGRKFLLKGLAEWSRDTLGIVLDPQGIDKTMSPMLEEWLESHFQPMGGGGRET